MAQSRISHLQTEILSDRYFTYKSVAYDYLDRNGKTQRQTREVLDRGDGVTILLYHRERRTVLLTRQFRLPPFLNQHPDGFLIETCAGAQEQEGPEESIRRETEEELGYQIGPMEKVFSAYMSPGAVTEVVHFFIAEYTDEMKVHDGGGHPEEQEEIEAIELTLPEALAKIRSGEICDAKTIMLLQYAALKQLV